MSDIYNVLKNGVSVYLGGGPVTYPVAPPVPSDAIPINNSGDVYFETLKTGPNLFSITTTAPKALYVAWGQTPKSPQSARITATMTGPGGSWTGAGTQAGGSVTSGSAAVPPGVYYITLTTDNGGEQSISPKITTPR